METEEPSNCSSTITVNIDGKNENHNAILYYLKKIYEFCEAYGSVIGCYCSVLGITIPAFITPIINDYQGGCRFPYVSEVSRSGLRQWIFIIASILGGIPWIIFSFSYFGVFIRYAPQISNKFQRIIFQCLQFITLVFNILAAIGVLATAIFDMGHFPTVHPYAVGTFAVPLNLLAFNNVVDTALYIKQSSCSYILRKAITVFVSFFGMLGFTLVGGVNNCASQQLPFEDCLRETAESYCFRFLDKANNGYTIVRHYPNCRTMHFWRGFVEYVALLASTELLMFLFYDRNTMYHQIANETGYTSSNAFIRKESDEQQNDEIYSKLSEM